MTATARPAPVVPTAISTQQATLPSFTLEATRSAAPPSPTVSVDPTRAPTPAPTPKPTPKPAKPPSPKPEPTPAPSRQPVAMVTGVTATWYCRTGISRCTVGYPGGLYAAISPDLSYLRGRRIDVCWSGSCVRVRVIDCDCQAFHSIDLYSDAFVHLAPLSAGRLRGVELRG